MRCPKYRFPIRIIVIDELEIIIFESQGLTLSTASQVWFYWQAWVRSLGSVVLSLKSESKFWVQKTFQTKAVTINTWTIRTWDFRRLRLVNWLVAVWFYYHICNYIKHRFHNSHITLLIPIDWFLRGSLRVFSYINIGLHFILKQ